MSALTLMNSQTDMRVVVLSPEGIVRPVAMSSENSTHQCLCHGDIMIYHIHETKGLRYSIYGKSIDIKASEVEVDEKLLDTISEFVYGDLNLLPVGLGRNGTDTIQSVALDLGLDIFLTG